MRLRCHRWCCCRRLCLLWCLHHSSDGFSRTPIEQGCACAYLEAAHAHVKRLQHGLGHQARPVRPIETLASSQPNSLQSVRLLEPVRRTARLRVCVVVHSNRHSA